MQNPIAAIMVAMLTVQDNEIREGAMTELRNLVAHAYGPMVRQYIETYGLPLEVQELLLQGRKIYGIKWVRDNFRVSHCGELLVAISLKDAKEIVEQYGSLYLGIAEATHRAGMKFRLNDHEDGFELVKNYGII